MGGEHALDEIQNLLDDLGSPPVETIDQVDLNQGIQYLSGYSSSQLSTDATAFARAAQAGNNTAIKVTIQKMAKDCGLTYQSGIGV